MPRNLQFDDINIEYRILAVDKARGQIAVRFYNADLPEGFVYAVDLPTERGRIQTLRGQQLHEYLRGFCPVAEFERAAELKVAQPDLDYLDALVEEDVVPAPPPPPVPEEPPVRERPQPLPGEMAIGTVDL
jgi:hypothetical protein